MKRYASLVCFLAVSFALSAPSVFAQSADSPFNGKAKNPFQTDAPAGAAVIEIDNATMRKCFQMIRHGLQIAELKGKRIAANDENRINKSHRNRKAQKATEDKVKDLTQQIKQRQSLFDGQLSKTKFADQGQAEFESRIDAIEQNETETIVRVERLKMQIRHMADENQKLRQQLAELQREN